MFKLVEKIDEALEKQTLTTLIDKSGRYYHGTIKDSWVRISGGKVRGKIQFESDKKGEIEIDANDILDIIDKK